MIHNENFDTAFNEIFEDVLGGPAQVHDEDSPRTIEGWGSLAHIRLLNELESRFGVRLPDEALFDEQNVGSLKRMVLEQAERV